MESIRNTNKCFNKKKIHSYSFSQLCMVRLFLHLYESAQIVKLIGTVTMNIELEEKFQFLNNKLRSPYCLVLWLLHKVRYISV